MKNLTLLLISLLLYSCSSDDDSVDNNPDPSETYYKLVRESSFNEDGSFHSTHNYEYDSNNGYRLSSLISDHEFDGIEIFYYGYDSSNKIIHITDNFGIVVFEYEGELIIKFNAEATTLQEYFYNSLDQMVHEVRYGGCEADFNYNNQGNVSSYTYSCTGNVISYLYDDKNNPFSLVYPIPLFKILEKSNNNVLLSSNGDSNLDITITYEYNPEGYPTLKNTYFQGELIGYTLYEYEIFGYDLMSYL